jgi:hypothetical protein
MATSDVDYMISRVIGLAITDLRGWDRRKRTDTFSIVSAPGDSAIYLPELIFAFQLWLSAKRLVADLNSIRIPRHWEREILIVDDSPIGSGVDWGATLERWADGLSGFVTESVYHRRAARQAREAADYIVEVLGHIEAAEFLLLEKLSGDIPAYVMQLLQDFQEFSTRLSEHLTDVLKEDPSWIEHQAAYYRGILESVVRDGNHSGNSISSRYDHLVQRRRVVGPTISSALVILSRWREHYLTQALAVTGGDQLRYTHTFEPSELYELWCFHEIGVAINALGLGSVLQHSFLRARSLQNAFSIASEYEVFFDFEKRPTSGDTSASRASAGIPGVRIEWFLQHRTDWRRSICIDAKYAKWRSSYALTTLGYMNAFGVNHGILLMPERPSSLFTGSTEVTGLWKRVLPQGGLFWYCILTPSRNCEASNQDRIRKLLLELFERDLAQPKRAENPLD